jgi:hypothetical protein
MPLREPSLRTFTGNPSSVCPRAVTSHPSILRAGSGLPCAARFLLQEGRDRIGSGTRPAAADPAYDSHVVAHGALGRTTRDDGAPITVCSHCGELEAMTEASDSLAPFTDWPLSPERLAAEERAWYAKQQRARFADPQRRLGHYWGAALLFTLSLVGPVSRMNTTFATVAPGRNRTYDLWLRRPALYPLSYERARPV